MTATTEKTLFSLLPEKRPPWMQFLCSISTQGLTLCVLAWIGVIRPGIALYQARDYHFVQLISPPIQNSLPAPLDVLPKRTLREASPKAPRLPLEIRREVRHEDTLVAPKVILTKPDPTPLLPIPISIPQQIVKTDVFSSETLASTTIAITPQTIQLGGFGAATGIVAEENKGSPIKIRLDSFDHSAVSKPELNVSNVSKGDKAPPLANFENRTATPERINAVNANQKFIHDAGFEQIKPETIVVRPKLMESSMPKTISAEIILKPNPIYTDEARPLRIEGEVLLDVVFESRGKVRVIRVISGLGHGLDEAAIRAAERIRFIPAQHGNEAIDFSAVLHILFRLA